MPKIRNKRILVVDDLPQDTRLLQGFLEQNGYVVRVENDPTAALSAAEEFKPDLILMDVMMPEISGGELAALFKADPKTKDIPILFLTATITKEDADLCGGRIGKYRFLAKPIVLTEVLTSVQRHLRGAR